MKRYHFNRIAVEGGYDALATGHNLDDEVARLFANTLRWDTAYLSDQGPVLPASDGFVRKVKPLFRLSEFETANYAFLKGIEIHSDPCPYASGASFTGHKELWGELEHRSPGQKFQFYQSFLKKGKPAFAAMERETGPSFVRVPSAAPLPAPRPVQSAAYATRWPRAGPRPRGRRSMAEPRISVTMPCYNCGDTVGRALDSLLAQRCADFEVVAVTTAARTTPRRFWPSMAVEIPASAPSP